MPTGQAWEFVEHASVVCRPVYVAVGSEDSVAETVTIVVAVAGDTIVMTVKLVEACAVYSEVAFKTPTKR
jgi:hypothetical protein